jgi:NAD(P)-dependent dehydrogenase (short-subunit alcohol dehydrogenase family)
LITRNPSRSNDLESDNIPLHRCLLCAESKLLFAAAPVNPVGGLTDCCCEVKVYYIVNRVHIRNRLPTNSGKGRAPDGGTPWTESEIPSQTGRTAIVTGASSGIGLETARVLAERDARVVLACRDPGKAKDAAARIRRTSLHTDIRVVRLDLASLGSVREAAGELLSSCDRIDLLILNGGVMEPPYQRTKDGFELTFATNHLGHFALNGLLLDRMREEPGSRIVTVSSEGHARGAMNFDDLQAEHDYRADRAYYQSKLANVLFTYELDRRLKAAGAQTIALACHPGIVLTDLYRTRSSLERALLSPRLRLVNSWLVQSAQMGALPTLRAATDRSARGGEFYGPPGRGYTGHPVRVQSSSRSHDPAAQRRLWQESERLTGVTYAI